MGKLKSVISKRLGIAIVAGIVLIATVENAWAMTCLIVIACTYLICETIKPSK